VRVAPPGKVLSRVNEILLDEQIEIVRRPLPEPAERHSHPADRLTFGYGVTDDATGSLKYGIRFRQTEVEGELRTDRQGMTGSYKHAASREILGLVDLCRARVINCDMKVDKHPGRGANRDSERLGHRASEFVCRGTESDLFYSAVAKSIHRLSLTARGKKQNPSVL
jgi:hypothetical protein